MHFAQLYSCFTAYGLDTSQPFVDLLADARALGPTRIVPFFGVDNSYLFGFLYPWISIHLGLCNFLPAAMQCSYFLLRNGAKLSSSRNNAVWARDLVGDVGLRRARSALAASSPEGSNRTFDESFGGFVSATDGVEEIGTSSDAFASVAALRDRIARCADPRVFSLTEIANLIDKATAYAARLKRLCDKEKESAAITVEISALVDQLSI